MGKYEIQSMPINRSEGNNYICAHTTCKNLYFNGNAQNTLNISSKGQQVNGLVNGVNKALANGLTNGINKNSFVNGLMGMGEFDEKEENSLDIPQNMEVLSNQVAGHKEAGGVGMLKQDGLVFKPLLKKDCAETEIQLYEQLETTVDRSLIEMRQLVPKYHGVKKLPIKGKEIDFLVLEDLTKDFKEPCIMDIKIGRRTWDPNASYEKIISEEKKYHECKRDLGFCIPGFQVYQLPNNRLVKYDKEYGKKLNKDTVKDAIKIFLNAESNQFCRRLLVQFLAALWQIQHFARNQRRHRFYATSILLVYDARRLREHSKINSPAQKEAYDRPTLVRNRSLYRPLSLATLNNGCCERIPTGFSGQLTLDGPILKAPSKKIVNLDGPRIVNCNNTWQKSIHALKRTHSFQNNYDKDVQNKKQNYTYILDDLCCDTKSEVWATAKMIDFAHVYPADSIDVDKNYLDGVNNLIKVFEDFLAETQE